MKRFATFFSLIMGFLSCSVDKSLETVKQVDIDRYQGKWYEIARLPNRFEKGLVCVSATYTLKPDGKINVLNQGRVADEGGKLKSINGTAWVPNAQYPGRLKVSFFWPFAGRYWIIALDPEYRYALVGDPSRDYLWILSRTKQLPADTVKQLTDSAKKAGFDTDKLLFVDQQCVD